MLAAALAVVTVGKPWLTRRWRRTGDLSIVALAVTMAIAGGGVSELLLALSLGGCTAAVVLVALGAPNRRPTAMTISASLQAAGIDVEHLELRRAVGGRSQLYRARTPDGEVFLKVYAQDSRDADLLYRSYRTAVLREPGQGLPSPSLAGDIEHEAFMLLLAERAGVASPSVRGVVALPDGSMVLAMEEIPGRRLDELAPDEIDPRLLDAVWSQVGRLHRAGLAHGALRAANILVDNGRPSLIDLGAGTAAATERARAIDRAELLASLAALVGVEVALAAAARTVDATDLAAAMPYLQPRCAAGSWQPRLDRRRTSSD
jgi:undecaprenyl-diphosphatase